MNASEVLIIKFKSLPIKIYLVTEINMVENVLFFKNEETLITKLWLNKVYDDIDVALQDNSIIIMP